MRGRRAVLRNALLFAVAVCALAALIGLMYLRKPVRILPPEPPEITAKRQAPENAYFALVEAVKMLPAPPPPLIVPDPEYPQLQAKYRPPKGSPQEALGILRPEDDPEFAKYLEQAAPVVAKVREALAKPFFLHALDWSAYENFAVEPQQGLAFLDPLRLGGLLAVSGAKSLRDSPDSNETYAYFHDALRLGQMLAEEDRSGFEVESRVPVWLAKAAPAFSDETLRAAQEDLRTLRGTQDAAVLAALEFEWRKMDNAKRFAPPGAPPAAAAAASLMVGFGLKRFRTVVAQNQNLLREAALLSYPAYQQWMRTHSLFHGHSIEVPSPSYVILELVRERASAETACLGAEAVLALELYRRANGTYPDTLDALVPQFLPAVPKDPYGESGAALLYRLQDKDYVLYSLGPIGSDQGGNAQQGNMVIHGKSEPDEKPGDVGAGVRARLRKREVESRRRPE